MNKSNLDTNNINVEHADNNEEDNICKYCLQETKQNQQLVFPCDCKTGVHPSCLTSWINFRQLQQRNNLLKCELCNKNYKSIQLIMLLGNSIDNGGNLIESKYSERSININIPHNNVVQQQKCGCIEIFFYGLACSSLSAVFTIYIVDDSFEKENKFYMDFMITIVNICFLFGFLISIVRLRNNRIIRQQQRESQINLSYSP